MSGFTPLAFTDFEDLLATQYAAVANTPANTDPGSTLGSIFAADALLATQGQQGLVYLQNISRLATSTGSDIDSFVQPFGVSRLAAGASSGSVTFTTNSPVSQQLVVPVGTIVQTTGNLQFTVIADNTQAGYNASQNGYVIAVGQSSVVATIQCLVAGSLGNVQAGQITQIYGGPGGQPVIGVTGVNNASAYTNGRDPETDAELATRFTLAMSAGRVATQNALASTVLGVQAGLTYSIGDQLNSAGSVTPGTVTIVVNQLGQNSAPSSALLTAVQTAINTVRSAGITVTVIAPTLVAVNCTATLHVAANYTTAAVQTAAIAAYNSYINNIGLDPAGASITLGYFDVGMILRQVPGVSRVDALSINGGNTDISTGFAQQFVNGTSTFTMVQP